jgi:putative ABC transport system permease protein
VKFFPLLFSNIKRRKLRTILTIGSYFIAFFLFGLLAAIQSAFNMGVDVAGANRLVVTNKTSLIMPLPHSYKEKIEEISGVKRVTYASWFGGYYQDPKNFFAQMAVNSENFFDVYSEFKVDKDEYYNYMKDRQGVIVGRQTAERYGFKVGDRVPIIATIFGGVWEFNVRGIYDGTRPGDDNTQFLFHASYLEERRMWGKGMVGWYVVEVFDPEQSLRISEEIDAKFANSPWETKTDTEKAFAVGFVKQIGNIELIILSIGAIVFFTLILVTSNTMGISVKERSGEIAVLKTIGYSDKMLYFLTIAESFIYSISGGWTGLLCAKLFSMRGDPTGGFLPIFYITNSKLAAGLVFALVIGFCAGAYPSYKVLKLKIVEALGRV